MARSQKIKSGNWRHQQFGRVKTMQRQRKVVNPAQFVSDAAAAPAFQQGLRQNLSAPGIARVTGVAKIVKNAEFGEDFHRRSREWTNLRRLLSLQLCVYAILSACPSDVCILRTRAHFAGRLNTTSLGEKVCTISPF